MTRRSYGCRAAIVLAAAILLSGCGANEHAAPSRRGAEVRDPALERPPPAHAVRFAPHRPDAAIAIPVELMELCQPAAGEPGAGAPDVDTLAMPRSPRRLIGISGEGALDHGVRCIVRNAEQWGAVQSLALVGAPDLGLRRVDFGREMLVVATTGGPRPMFSEIWIDGSWARGDTLVLAVNDRSDSGGPGTGATDASPAVVVAVPRVRGPVFFIEH